MSQTAPTPHGSPDSRRHRDGQSASLMLGVVLILLGGVFLLQQAGLIRMTDNWWALFIYIGAVASFANAWRSYRATGEFGAAATGSLTWGLVFTVVASIFFFNLLWDIWWPAILIAVGTGIVAGYVLGVMTRKPSDSGS